MRFIPVDQIKQLREAAKNGDDRAKKILRAQLEGKDFGSELEAFFAQPGIGNMPMEEIGQKVSAIAMPGPVQENKGTGNPKLDKFLADNGVKEGDADYDDAVNDYYNEFPNERPATESAPQSDEQDIVGIDTETPADVEEEVDLTRDIASSIISAIQKCDETLLAIMQNEEIEDTSRKGAMTTLQEVKQSLFDSAEKIKKIKKSLTKEEEKEGEF